jgi:O-antigen/teichoic acid export membrane protein
LGKKWTNAPLYLTLYVINNLFCIFGNMTLGSMLAGIGETKTQMKLSLITLTIGIPLASILIPNMGVVGLILTGIIAPKPSLLVGLHWIHKKYKAKIDINSSIRILIASTTAATTTFLATNITTYTDWIELAIGITAFTATYLITAPTLGAINKNDINNLKTIFSELGIISKLINIPLAAMEKLSSITWK